MQIINILISTVKGLNARADKGGKQMMMAALLAIMLCPVSATAEATDVEKLDVDGFRLGMTMEEVKEKWPDLKIKEVVRSKVHVGYQAHRGEVHVSFSSKDLGSKIFHVQLMRIYKDKPDSYPIYMEFVNKYGRPDFGGRQMMNINACWGNCYGSNKKLEFSMTVVGFGNKPFPMTLTLTDPVLEKANHDLFKQLIKK
ncbi:MAG: hypothetical protein OEZ55_06735 [Nitrospinota bacterium]|nr:hypothetical protein [Nitrospinota bacterium]